MSSSIRRSSARVAVALVLSLLVVEASRARPVSSDPALAAELDAMMTASFPADAPGAAVIVVKNGEVILRKGYGLANLELKTPMRPEMVFEIGSVTKQFTSAAIMLLVEQGKVALDADVRTYLPDFPDKGAKITVEHLLTHTSGVKDYTEDPKWPAMWRQDLTPQQIIDLTKDQPLEFAPGTKWKYDNTGYVMLGAIVEKAAGMSYPDFVRKNIFEPFGMTSSSYADNTSLVANRASGYSRDANGWKNAIYLSMTQPYAAGSLMSSVDDLARWDAAVSAGKLLSKASWDRVFTPYVLASGEKTSYGYGWMIGSYASHPVVRHNGGIFGYVSEVARLPKDNIYVAMLTNSDAPPVDTGFLVTKLAAVAVGEPYREPTPAAIDAKTFDAYVGVYRIDESTTRAVTREGDRYFVQRTGRPKTEIFPLSETEFFLKNSLQRFTFVRDSTGKVTGMETSFAGTSGSFETAKRTDEPLPTAPKEVAVAPEVLARYPGVYEIAPTFAITVTLEDGHLMTQATGQRKVEIFPKSDTEFFLKVVDAQITFVTDASGKVEKLVLHQGGRDVPAPKVK